MPVCPRPILDSQQFALVLLSLRRRPNVPLLGPLDQIGDMLPSKCRLINPSAKKILVAHIVEDIYVSIPHGQIIRTEDADGLIGPMGPRGRKGKTAIRASHSERKGRKGGCREHRNSQRVPRGFQFFPAIVPSAPPKPHQGSGRSPPHPPWRAHPASVSEL